MTNSVIPTWIKIFAWILAIFGLFLGVAAYIAPDLVIGGFATDTPERLQAMGMLGGRNLAMAITLIVALLSKRPGFLMLAFIMRLVTEFTDMIISATTGIMGFPVAALIAIYVLLLIVPEILAIRKLRSIEE